MRLRDVRGKAAPPAAEERPEPADPPSRPHEHAGDKKPRRKASEVAMETFRIEVGLQHGVKPGNIVGAIANEAELDSQYIGRVQIFDDHSLVELPEGIPKETFHD